MIKHLRIGACEYKIEEITADSDADFVGRCHPNQQLIEIDKRLPEDKKRQTIMHEVIHAICFEYGNIRLTEKNTDILATALVSLLKDNPKFKGWL